LFVSTSKAIFQSLGDTKTLFKAGCINAIFTGALIILGVRTGSIETIALLVAVANWGNMFTTITMLMTKGFHKSPIGFLAHFSKDLLAIVIMVAILELVTPYVPITNVLLSFGFKLVLTMALYGAYLWITKGYEPFVSLLSGFLKKKGKAPTVEKIRKDD
jgi:PST family polysaccharide transporter